MKIREERGIALIISLFVIVILIGLSSMFILRAVHDAEMAKKERAMAKSFYLAEAGSHAALDELDNLINNFMLNTVTTTNPSTLVNTTQGYVTSNDGVGFLVTYVKDGGVPQLTLNGSQAEYTLGSTNLGDGDYQYQIIIREKSDPIVVTSDTWDFPYNYRVESTGSAKDVSKDVLLSGDFTVRIQRDNFAKYALFTNSQTTEGGTNVWFTDKTNFVGPLHTNGRYNIALNPSGTFEGIVEQQEQRARFYNNGWTILLNDDHNGTIDVPTFNAGFNRDVDAVTLASSAQQQDMIDQATGNQNFPDNGIYVPNNGSSLTGGIYVKGNASVTLQIDGSNNAKYKIVQSGTTKYVTVDRNVSQTTVEIVGGGTSTYNGVPDGADGVGTIIYVNGKISKLKGTVQEKTQLTVASKKDIIIKDHLMYSDYTPGSGTPGTPGYIPPSAQGKDNLLGLVSWDGDVRIGTAAPNGVNIHGTLLAQDGVFTVDDYNNYGVGPRGTATLLGGAITDNYGAFGLFSGSTGQQLTGYGRNFVYDKRMQSGNAPPYFPSLSTFIAFTNDITDKLVWQEGGF